jgi:hypothetical protein
MTAVTKVEVPLQSLLTPTLASADFYDSYQVENSKPERSPLQIWLDVVTKPMPWIQGAMSLRNKIVSHFGLKTGDIAGLIAELKTKPATDYKVGDRIGIFNIYSISEHELVMGEDDKHLDVRLSLYKSADGVQVTISTVVHVHNFLGRVYMFFVVPGHRIIAPYMTAKI